MNAKSLAINGLIALYASDMLNSLPLGVCEVCKHPMKREGIYCDSICEKIAKARGEKK